MAWMDDDPLLARWLALLQEAHLLMGPREAVASELAGWLAHLREATPEARSELNRQVALHARALGAEGRPASAALAQLQLLRDALGDAGDAELLRALERITVDAHAAGAAARQQRHHARVLQRSAPILHLPGVAVAGFLVGSMEAEVVDALFGRLLRAMVGTPEPRLILDVGCAPPDDDTFHRTLLGFTQAPEFAGRVLRVSGLPDPDATAAALARLQVPAGRIRLFARFEEALAPTVNVP
jgi:hypothetical protein